MAGATAELLIVGDPALALATWATIVEGISARVRGRDFWVEPAPADRDDREALPFFWNQRAVGEPLGAIGDDPVALATLRDRFGIEPDSMSIAFAAMCRGRASDRILARLAVELLTRHRGVLLFHGLLAPSLDAAEWRAWSESPVDERLRIFAESVVGHPGTIVTLSCDGEPAYQAADLEFLRYWREHPAFHFVN